MLKKVPRKCVRIKNRTIIISRGGMCPGRGANFCCKNRQSKLTGKVNNGRRQHKAHPSEPRAIARGSGEAGGYDKGWYLADRDRQELADDEIPREDRESVLYAG